MNDFMEVSFLSIDIPRHYLFKTASKIDLVHEKVGIFVKSILENKFKINESKLEVSRTDPCAIDGNILITPIMGSYVICHILHEFYADKLTVGVNTFHRELFRAEAITLAHNFSCIANKEIKSIIGRWPCDSDNFGRNSLLPTIKIVNISGVSKNGA